MLIMLNRKVCWRSKGYGKEHISRKVSIDILPGFQVLRSFQKYSLAVLELVVLHLQLVEKIQFMAQQSSHCDTLLRA